MSQIIENIHQFSPYVASQLNRYPEWAEASLWQEALPDGELFKVNYEFIMASEELAELNHRLRKVRNQQMVRIALRDLQQLATLEETMRDTSDLADVLVNAAMDWHYNKLTPRLGTPMGEDSGEAQKMLVLGMGKLGGQELNFSSDIDLIFVFPEKGYTEGGRQRIDNEQFFTRLGQAMNKSLADFTEDGIVYRVDMRLRPFGSTGPLAVSFTAMENYYALHGRAWERYALVKARMMAGDKQQGKELFNILRPFVYRKYVDFSALDALRGLKQQIEAKVKEKGMEDNLKLGPGGIREIEFVVQVFQLIHGGRLPVLQGRSLLPMLTAVGETGFLTQTEVAELEKAYHFLRRAENRVQEWNDQQAHDLPTDETQLQMMATTMGFDSTALFLDELASHRKIVQAQFDRVFAVEEDNCEAVDQFDRVWQSEVLLVDEGVDYGFDQSEEVFKLIKQFHESPKVQKLPNESRERLDKAMPLFMKAVASQDCSHKEVLERGLRVFESILRRSVYFLLLIENPNAMNNFVKVSALSPWMAEMLSKYPVLLDQLLDESNTINPLSKEDLMAEALKLQNKLQGDDESFMNQLRQWRHIQVFKVAMADITGNLPIMKVSDYLTWIAEAVMEACVRYAWLFMNKKNGLPGGVSEMDMQNIPFIVLGYGKMGGIELGYGSDLDVVFLYEGLESSAMSAGPRQLENSVYFVRMGQKVISLMTTMMPTGILYEIDARLRPNGNSGLLVTDLKHYKSYIENKAWVWEHQAMVRSRAVAGGELSKQAFEAYRCEFIQQPRNEADIKKEVLDMRLKMRKSLDKTNPEFFDLKQGSGGIVDIEFMVQYFLLSFAHELPDLAVYSDNIRMLEAIENAELLPHDEVEQLQQAYKDYRARYHQLALQNIKSLINQDEFVEQRQFVSGLWQSVMVD